MRNAFLTLTLLFVVMTSIAAEPAEGLWFGSLSLGAKQLRVAVRIEHKEGRLTGTLDSLDQGRRAMQLDEVTFDGGTLRFTLKALGAEFEGTLNGEKLSGAWKQRGLALPLELSRVDAIPAARRPQEPKRPFPYDEHEVVVENAKGAVRLAGTLTVPRTAEPHAAVVLVSGSGPQDRDETVFGHRPFLVLSDYLTRRGIAVLRVDDRGVGASTGERKAATSEDYAGDVAACVAFLKTRREIDAKHIGLIGHSEGGMIAPIVAAKSSDVAFIILLAAPGVPGDELVNLQGTALLKSMGATAEQVETFGALQGKIIALAKETPDENALRAKLKEVMSDAVAQAPEEERSVYQNLEQMVDAQIKRLTSPWYRYLLAWDPSPVLRQVRVPILAINGSKDIQVLPKENLGGIAKARPAATIVELPGLNHLLQTAPTGALAEYAAIEETMAPVALQTIADWIEKTVR